MSQASDERNGIDEVMALARSGNRADAYKQAMELVRQNPDDVLALLWLAYTSAKVEEVEAVLHRVLSLDPNNQKALEWQALILQKQQRMQTGQTGPLPPTVTLPTYLQPPTSNREPSPRAGHSLPSQPPVSPYLNMTNPSPSANNKPQPYQANPQPLTPWTTPLTPYQVTVEPGPPSNPMLPYVQSTPSAPKAKRRWWPLVLVASLLVVALIVVIMLVTNPTRSNLALADYRLFTSLDDLMRDGFVDERVAIEARFMGGLTKDAQGTYLIVLSEGKSTLYVQWHESVTPVNDFRPGQFVTIYGRLSGLNGGKGTLKVDKVLAIT
jgi:Tfp pilus assembly protein PilN